MNEAHTHNIEPKKPDILENIQYKFINIKLKIELGVWLRCRTFANSSIPCATKPKQKNNFFLKLKNRKNHLLSIGRLVKFGKANTDQDNVSNAKVCSLYLSLMLLEMRIYL